MNTALHFEFAVQHAADLRQEAERDRQARRAALPTPRPAFRWPWARTRLRAA
ncbi:hypothetical protein [Deinococcus sp. Leaf326]|uniref:hypothetical protein n=1 Tax=Deinococcus sp. Leaf326 TaxID=1736338 RepID=UPI000AEF8441|nr:hypothetical protein [Deinococcus sp. Leaf326]